MNERPDFACSGIFAASAEKLGMRRFLALSMES
jgi:hypothetical protein